MRRRAFLSSLMRSTLVVMAASGAAAGMASHAAAAQPAIDGHHPLYQCWLQWKALCLSPEGRVIDGYQDAASHSEGQGYGLTMAAIFQDQPAFEAIKTWTEANLAVRDDALMAWRWLPKASPQIPDRNNASDGDLFYAWGLVLAASWLKRPELIDQARRIAEDIQRLCAAPHPDGSGALLLLPAASGFQHEDRLVLNPSYYMPRAMQDLATATGVTALAQMAETGRALIQDLASRGLVPDWIALGPNGFEAAPNSFSQNSGYEAIRVPLMALWSGDGRSAAVTQFATATAHSWNTNSTPVVMVPASHEVMERSTHPGYAAVAALCGCAATGSLGSVMPGFTVDQPYYPATLHLMALVAQASNFPECFPL